MIFLDPKSPHAFMKTSGVQIPHSKAPRNVGPEGIHAQIKQIGLPSGVWGKVLEVCTWVFGII